MESDIKTAWKLDLDAASRRRLVPGAQRDVDGRACLAMMIAGALNVVLAPRVRQLFF